MSCTPSPLQSCSPPSPLPSCSPPSPCHAHCHPSPLMTLCLSRTVITLTLCKSGCQFLVLLSCPYRYTGGPCMAQPCPQYASINHSVNVTAYALWRRKIRLIEGNAKRCHLTKLTCNGTLRQMFICLRPRTPYPIPPYTLYVCIQYTYSHRWGGGGI